MQKLVLFTLKSVATVLALASHAAADEKVDKKVDKEAQQILQRAIQAVGGETTLARLKAPMMWMERGTFHGMEQPIHYVGRFSAKWPDWYRQEIQGVFTITVNGEKAWVSNSMGVQKLAGSELEETLKQLRVSWAERLFPLTEEAYTLSKVDGIQVDGRPTVGIKASHADHRDMTFFFDKESYLIAKIETRVISPQLGSDPVLSEAFYKDHKPFGGIRMPSKLKLIYDQKLFVESETVDYKMAVALDPQHFEEPQ